MTLLLLCSPALFTGFARLIVVCASGTAHLFGRRSSLRVPAINNRALGLRTSPSTAEALAVNCGDIGWGEVNEVVGHYDVWKIRVMVKKPRDMC